MRCLRQFQLFYGKAEITGHWKPQLRYAYQFWSSHLHYREGLAIGLVLDGGTSIPALRGYLRLSSKGDIFEPLTLSLSSDGSKLSSTFRGENYRWDMKTGDPNPLTVLTGHQGAWVCCVAFSPHGKQLVSGSNDCSVILWDMQKYSLVGTLEGHTGRVLTVAFSPVENIIASGSDDMTIRLWDPTILQSIAVLQGHRGQLCSVPFSPDGTMIVSGSSDKTVRIWDARSGQPDGSPLCGHTGTVWSVAYTPDGQQIISGSHDGTIRVWNGLTGELLSRTVSNSGIILTLSISPDGNRVFAGSTTGVRAWTRNGNYLLPVETPFHLNTAVYSLAFSPDGKSVALDTSEGPNVNYWDLQTGRSTRYVGKLANHIHRVAFSPDGSKIVFGNRNVISIWDTPQFATTSRAYTVSPDGTLILSHSFDGTVQLRDSRTEFSIGHPLQCNVGILRHIIFSSDSSRIGGATEGEIYLWDAPMKRLIADGTRGSLPPIVSLYFGMDRQALISTHNDGSVHALEETEGHLTACRQSFDADDDLLVDHPSFFTVDEEHPEEVGGTRWFHAKEGHSGL